MATLPQFSSFQLTGDDSEKFLQGQLTCNVLKLADSNDKDHYQATAISNLKGRIQFGIWIRQLAKNQFEIVSCTDCTEELLAHIKKFGAFSKIDLTEIQAIYPTLIDDKPTFTHDDTLMDSEVWARTSIAQGNYWITHNMQDSYQPQEMRLHQRGGVDYDKGCYLGQEVIARIYFKSAPKSYLHRITGTGNCPQSNDKIGEKSRVQIVNAIATADNRFEALVIARPDALSEFELLPLPTAMSAGVARKQS